ncbi:unnamed protein product [Darwinula stevensoni]|uniref:Mitochondrial import inner membrane translocase subunit TIM50 n=1 Tax=Darwinula stevensoni TaxID=69355 RepID=A0A7R8X0T5_9CRUS|nr:unnamed protein product [Darwinula stevensoni]CAG0882049.1 unnamed protein product [Darwinula stevensoni]
MHSQLGRVFWKGVHVIHRTTISQTFAHQQRGHICLPQLIPLSRNLCSNSKKVHATLLYKYPAWREYSCPRTMLLSCEHMKPSVTTLAMRTMTDSAESKEKQDKANASLRAMKYSFIVLSVLGAGVSGFLLVTWGAPHKDEDGNDIEDEFSHLPTIKQYLKRTWREVKVYNKMIQEPSREKLLPEPLKEPYIQPPYTLVLEMTGVLVHPDWTYQTGWRFKKRPGVDFFLQQVGPPLFEVVIYTSEQGFTAFPILDALDPNGFIMYRLFRDATRYLNGHHVKDLNCLNRDLSKVILVDWNENSFSLNPRNALHVRKWTGNDDDRTLIDLAIMLKTIGISGVNDVREVLDYYRQFDDPLEAFRENQRRLQEQEAMQEQELKENLKRPNLASGWNKGLFGGLKR